MKCRRTTLEIELPSVFELIQCQRYNHFKSKVQNIRLIAYNTREEGSSKLGNISLHSRQLCVQFNNEDNMVLIKARARKYLLVFVLT